MARQFLLPEVLRPDERRFVCIGVPDAPGHRQAFLGAMLKLARASSWETDEYLDAKTVSDVWFQVWRDTALQLDANFDSCGERVIDPCLAYAPTAPFIEWIPVNPFEEAGVVPSGYLIHPWMVGPGPLGSVINDVIDALGLEDAQFFQVNPGDVILNPFMLINVLATVFNPPQPGEGGLPGFRVRVVGTGTVKLHFNNIPFGGLAVISIDSPVDFLDVFAGIIDPGSRGVDLNLDLSLPPESDFDVIEEVTFDTPGEHYIEVAFVPVVDDSFVPLRWGGGLKYIEICGFLEWQGLPSEGLINEMSDPCGCDGFSTIYERMLGGALAALNGTLVGKNYRFGEEEPTEENPEGGFNFEDLMGGFGDPGGAPPLNLVELGYTEAQFVGGKVFHVAEELRTAYMRILDWLRETNWWDGANWIIPALPPALQDAINTIRGAAEFTYVAGYAGALYDIDENALARLIIHQTTVATQSYLVDVTTLPEYFFCEGVGAQAIYEFALEDPMINREVRDFYFLLAPTFTQSQYLAWYNEVNVPINDPGVFPCYRQPAVTVEFRAEDWSRFDSDTGVNIDGLVTGLSPFPTDRKLSIETSGFFTLPDGTKYDSFYRTRPDGTVQLNEDTNFRFYNGTGTYDGINLWPEPPHNAAGQYIWIANANAEYGDRIQPNIETMGSDDIAGATGTITIKITDAGER